MDSKYIYNKEKVFPRMRSERGEGKKAFWHKPILLARLLFLPNWVKNLGAPSLPLSIMLYHKPEGDPCPQQSLVHSFLLYGKAFIFFETFSL